ncbi:MAG: polyhydroxyalkanoic acid system family protein [Aquincola tertiaricarbonis]
MAGPADPAEPPSAEALQRRRPKRIGRRPPPDRDTMAQLAVHRTHTLGLAQARERAKEWVAQAERDYGLRCDYQAGEAQDRVLFRRSGVSGELHVSADRFDLQAQLGFLLSAYQGRIESQIEANLDRLLGPAG